MKLLVLLSIILVATTSTKRLKNKLLFGTNRDFRRHHTHATFDEPGCRALWLSRNPNYLQRVVRTGTTNQYTDRLAKPVVTCIGDFSTIQFERHPAGQELIFRASTNVPYIDCY